MPYKLRKAPKRDLYWVVNKETGEKYSKDPLPKERAEAQMRALYANTDEMRGKGKDDLKTTVREFEEITARMKKIDTITELNNARNIAGAVSVILVIIGVFVCKLYRIFTNLFE